MFSWTEFFISVVLVVLVFLIYLYLDVLGARAKCKWLPQAPSVPILGSLLEFGGHTETLNDMARLTNNPCKSVFVQIVNHWHIITKDYDLTQFILSSNKILDKSMSYDFLLPWLGTGLLTAPGTKWKSRRKILTPAFHFSILEQFVDIFNFNASILVNKLDREAVDKESVDIYNYITTCALDTISETAMGVSIDSQNGKHQDFVFAVKDMCRIVLNRSFSAWKNFDLLFRFSEDYKMQQAHLKVLHGFTNLVIEKRRREFQASTANGHLEKDELGRKRKLAFLDLLLSSTIDGQPLSQEDIREEVDTFMFEGHDTTSSGITSALFLLAHHPEIQTKVREELKDIFGQNRDRAATHQDLQDMKYLELVIKEVLRLYPPVPLIGRTTIEDTLYKGNIIPKGTILTIFIYGINRDPDYFESPEEFRPERFLDEEGKLPYSYVPFSAGPRNCIGQKFAILEMKSMISKVIKNFELFPTNPPHKRLLSNEAVLKSLNGAIINIKRHNW